MAHHMARHRRTTRLVLGLLTVVLLPAPAAAAPQASAQRDTPARTVEPYACRQDTHQRIPDQPPGHVHVPGLVEAPNGDLLFHMDGDPLRGPDNHGRGWGITRTYVSRMELGSNTWSRPVEIPYDNPDAAHNAVMFNDGHGRIHNFFTTRQGPYHVDSTLDYRSSDDNGRTWSDPKVLRAEHGWMFGNRPFRMSNGEAIVPVYKEGPPWGAGFLISGDNFDTYQVHPADALPWPGGTAGGIQAATVELDPGHLVAFLRTSLGSVYRTESLDYGRTWTPAVPTRFPNPWARVDLLRLDSGHLVLAYNDSRERRSPLVLAMSEDGGRTWPHTVTVEDQEDGTHTYPALLQTSDGWVHLGYQHAGGLTTRHLVFNEEYLRRGPDMPSDPQYSKLEYRNGDLRNADACRYRKTTPPGALDPAYACRQDIHPQDSDFPGVHVATLERAPNGDLLYGFYAGSREGADDVKTYLARLPAGASRWTTPHVVFDEPGRPDGNAVLWTDHRHNRVHLLFSTIMGSGWTDATLRMITSGDNGSTWSDPRLVRDEWGWLFGTRPFRMTNGDVLVPIYSETRWASGWYVSPDDLRTFTPYPGPDDATWPRSVGGMIQPATVELEPGHLLAYHRSRDFHIWKTESFDYGRTWTDATPTALPNNNSRVALLKLHNGHLVLAYNPTRSGRTPLRLALSTDGGRSWSSHVDIEHEPRVEFSYPYLVQSPDGAIHLGYTHRRQTMRHLVFTEEFVRSGPDLPSDPDADTRTEYVDRTLRDVEACDYALPGPAATGTG